MSVRLILVRHGETDWNKARILQGRTDTSLNKNGERQAGKTAVKLKKSGEKPYMIISSPLSRAFESAAIIAYNLKAPIPIIVNKNLAEKNLGSLQGKTWKEVKKIHGSNLKKTDKEQQYDFSVFGGEGPEETGRRVVDFLNYAIGEFDGKTIIVVTHAGILDFLSLIFYSIGIDFSHSLKAGDYSVVDL